MLSAHDFELVAADARIVQNADGMLLAIDAATDTLYGWKVDELVGTLAPMMVHPGDRDIVSKVRNRVRISGDSQGVQIRVRSFGGRWLWVECSFSAIPNDGGEFGDLTELMLRDVSARYLRDEALELLAHLRSVIDTADTFDDAVRHGLIRLAQWGGFLAAVGWYVDEASWYPHLTMSGASDHSCADSWRDEATRRDEVASVARTQTWARVGSTSSEPESSNCHREHGAGQALLIPIVASQTTVVVVELFGGDSVVAGASAQLVIDVAQQLGDMLRRRRIEADLELARRHFGLAFEEAAIGMALVAPDGAFIDANASLCRLLGRERHELAMLGFQAVTHPEDLQADLEYVGQMLAGDRTTYQMEKRYLHSDGSVIWGLLSVSLVRDEAGEPVRFISQIQDITQRKHAEADVIRSERRYRSLVEPSVDMIVRLGVDGRVADVNHRAAAALAASPPNLVGRHLGDLVPESLARSVIERVTDVSTTGRPDEMWRQWLEPANRAPGWFVIRLMPEAPADESGQVEHVHLMASDITELVENEQRLSAMALVDPLTGVSNRAAVFDRLQHALDRLDRPDEACGVAVAIIDLDHFKAINDTFGHGAGDDALHAVAAALRRAVRSKDTVGRLGGDEFIVVFEDVTDRAQARELGQRLHEELAATTSLVGGDRAYPMSGSVGVAFTEVLVPMNDLVARADRAMYEAKSRGRGRTWTEGDRDAAATPSSSAMLRELAEALSKNQFELHYQPIARAEDCHGTGFEALLRWRHPELGLVLPDRFLDALFSTGQIGPVGHWVTRTAIQQLAAWQDDPATSHLRLNVNASPAELAYSGYSQILRDEIASWSVDPSRLSIEVTEQALAGSIVSSSTLAEIASTGVRLVLDDFGTGVSSLSHLRTRPLHGIKVDRSFISGAQTDSRERAIVDSVIVLANALDLDVTAEGVETEQQATWLRDAGCHHLQGWYIGYPLPADQIS